MLIFSQRFGNHSQGAIATVILAYLNLCRQALLEGFHVRDDPNRLASSLQCLQRSQRRVKGVGIQRTKAFINEQRINWVVTACQVRQAQRQRQTDQKGLSTGKALQLAHGICLIAIHNVHLDTRSLALLQLITI